MGQVKPKATYKAEQKTNEAALKRLQQLQKQPPHATPRTCNARAKRGEMPYFRYTDGLRSFPAGGGNVAAARMLMSNEVAQSTAEQAASQKATTAMMDTLYSNFGTFNLLLILFMTLPFWVAFRRQGQYAEQPLNLSEAATTMAFVGCQNMVVNIFSLPFLTTVDMGLVALAGYGIVIPLFVTTLWQLFEMPLRRFVGRLALLSVCCLFFYILTVYLILFYVVLTMPAQA